MERQELLRKLPKIDQLLARPELQGLDLPLPVLTDLARGEVGALRAGILSGGRALPPDLDALCAAIVRRAGELSLGSLRPVINGTGILLHTNLGRACLSRRAVQAVEGVASSYSTLEYDVNAGGRGARYKHVEALLCRITGAEGAMVVNNNAAAVLLILTCIARGGEVVVSRGELVEIGGSFRIPEIVEQCGCRLREVGATNKTRLRDYRQGITAETRAILKVHTSNYRVVGFTEAVPLGGLAALGEELGLPVIADLGSGCLVDLGRYGISHEPTVQKTVEAGADVISFSGDKLLGGPQAGIILGKRKWVEPLKAHPLARAVRVDKLTLAALEATLFSYLDASRAGREIPVLQMLSAPPETLRARAEVLCGKLRGQGVSAQAVAEPDQVGGGSVPGQELEGCAAAVTPQSVGCDQLEETLRRLPRPIIGRISKGRYLLSVRTLFDQDFDYIARQVGEAVR